MVKLYSIKASLVQSTRDSSDMLRCYRSISLYDWNCTGRLRLRKTLAVFAINESDGHNDMFKIIKKIKAHSISSLNAPIYQIKKHPFVPGVFATASADGTVRVFR